MTADVNPTTVAAVALTLSQRLYTDLYNAPVNRQEAIEVIRRVTLNAFVTYLNAAATVATSSERNIRATALVVADEAVKEAINQWADLAPAKATPE